MSSLPRTTFRRTFHACVVDVGSRAEHSSAGLVWSQACASAPLLFLERAHSVTAPAHAPAPAHQRDHSPARTHLAPSALSLPFHSAFPSVYTLVPHLLPHAHHPPRKATHVRVTSQSRAYLTLCWPIYRWTVHLVLLSLAFAQWSDRDPGRRFNCHVVFHCLARKKGIVSSFLLRHMQPPILILILILFLPSVTHQQSTPYLRYSSSPSLLNNNSPPSLIVTAATSSLGGGCCC
jgi:hypothetical protein